MIFLRRSAGHLQHVGESEVDGGERRKYSALGPPRLDLKSSAATLPNIVSANETSEYQNGPKIFPNCDSTPTTFSLSMNLLSMHPSSRPQSTV
jgi:hypothetical protein